MRDKNWEDEIAALLLQKGVTLPCSRCGNAEFEIVGEVEIPHVPGQLSRLPESFSRPLVLIACKNCGNLFAHVRTLLGLTG